MLPDEGTCAHHIRGLTHPGHYMIAATALYKRRGRLTATVRSDWVERLFVLTDSAIMWFDLGGGLVPRSEPIGTQQGRVDARHFVSTTVTERSGPASDNHEDLERLGPKYQLEIQTVTAEQSIVIGGTDKGVIDAWLGALARVVAHVGPGFSGNSAEEKQGAPELLAENLLRLELTGVVALGYLHKARDGMLKERKNGWCTRFLVLTETTLYYYKRPLKPASEDDLPLFGIGATLRSGEFIFGHERGRMPLANASVSCEQVPNGDGPLPRVPTKWGQPPHPARRV